MGWVTRRARPGRRPAVAGRSVGPALASNPVRHGKATSVVIRVHGAAGSLRVVVADDGKGFDVGAARTGGFGLRSMRDRVEKLGGSLAVRSEPGSRIEVEAAVPLR